jgi:indolepyruvate decarboxylase
MADQRSIGEYLADALKERGVRHVFGYPGDFILGFFQIGAARGLTMVNSTREEAAAYAADGYARENRLGAAAVTFGVGALAPLAALGGANAERVPVVLIAGGPGLGERDGRHIHHMPSDDMAAPRRLAAEITERAVLLDDPERAFEVIDETIEACHHHLRPVFIEVPRDQFDVRPEQVWRHEHRPARPSAPAGLDAAVADLVATVDAAERPVIWSGVRVLRRGCGHQVIELAERIGAPIVESVMGKGSVPEEHPLVLGVYSGLTTSHESVKDLVEDSDCVIELGIERNDINCGAFSVEIPLERSVELASDVRIGHRVYAGIPMITALEGLIAAGPRERAAPDDLPHSWATTPADASGPLTTDQITETLEQFLEPDDILTVDVGAVAHLTIDIRLAAAGQLHINRYYVGMGFAVPASTGAALARGAGRPVVLVGDGSFQMTGFDLSTAIRYGVRPIVLVLDNAGLTTERAIADGPFNDIAEWDYAAVGDVVGASGVEVATQADLHAALTRARAEEDRAWIISMKVDQHDYPRPLRELGKGLAELMHDSQGT